VQARKLVEPATSGKLKTMAGRGFDELVAEAEAVPIRGWDFAWLDGRAVEERPSWHYFDLVSERAAGAEAMADLQTGTAALVADLPVLPALTVATEGYEPNLIEARDALERRGAHRLRSLSERLMGPLPEGSARDPALAVAAAQANGLEVVDLRSERPRTAFYDIGAVVYFLRLVVWIVPDFTVGRYRSQLRQLHEHIERDGAFESTASRFLIEARKPG
jgi:hypothetical protein